MRLRDFQSRLKKEGVDTCLLINLEPWKDVNVTYFSDVEANGLLVINNPPKFFVSLLEIADAAVRSQVKTVVLKFFDETVKQYVKGKVVGLNFDVIPLSLFYRLKKLLKVKFVDVGPWLRELRMVKTDEEVVRLKKSAKVISTIVDAVIDKASHTDSELATADRVSKLMRDAGVVASFPTIVAAGKNAASPHHIPSVAKLHGFVVLDAGVVVDGYCSDITRTFFVGRPSRKELDIYEKVAAAQKLALDNLHVSCAAVHNRDAAVLGKDFIHALGHGIGREVHEAPRITASSKDVFQEGMVVAIEPGCYPKTFGVRIEDMVLCTNGRPRLLSSAYHGLVIKK